MPKAIVLKATGGTDQLVWQDVAVREPGPGEVLIRQKAIGLNFIDVYYRTGLYPLQSLPAVLGQEASGVIEKLGQGVEGFEVGDRVAYCHGPLGAYAEVRTIPAKFLAKLPDGISFEIAAAMMLKGLTAHYLTRRTFMVNQSHTVLVHAAAGGVGLLVCQWAKYLGGRVIGTVGSDTKIDIAKKNGCDEVIVSTRENIVERVRSLTGGAGVNCVYDSVGKDTWDISLDCLAPMGIMVSYGQSSGKIPAFDIGVLQKKGSLFLTRPILGHYIEKPEDFMYSCIELFEMVRQGLLKITVGQSYYLSDAASAHRDLEARKTMGATIMVVGN